MQVLGNCPELQLSQEVFDENIGLFSLNMYFLNFPFGREKVLC